MTAGARGKNTMQDEESVQRVIDGAAWREFCDALKAAGDVIISRDAPASAYDRAEGFRYLSRLTRAALETFVENADPQAPSLLRTAHETVKMGADNPDNLYQNAPISGKYQYVITGNRGSVHYLGFGTQAGNYGATGSLETTGYLDASQLTVDGSGNFSIVVSARAPEGATNTATGRSALRSLRQVRRMDSSRPPGVLSSMTSRSRFSSRARSTDCVTCSTTLASVSISALAAFASAGACSCAWAN